MSGVASILPSDYIPLVTGLGGALLVAIANYSVQRWRYKADLLAQSIDAVCREIKETAELSTEYWLLDLTQNADIERSKNLEPLLIGCQSRIIQSIEALKSVYGSKVIGATNNDYLLTFFEAVTGGSFGVSGRSAEHASAKLVQSRAAELAGGLRGAFMLSLRPRWKKTFVFLGSYLPRTSSKWPFLSRRS